MTKRRVIHSGLGFPILLLPLLVTGCSVHPMLDDVSTPYRTEDVIRHARCEMRDAVIATIRQSKHFYGASAVEIVKLVDTLTGRIKAIDEANEKRPNPATWMSYKDRLSEHELWLKGYMEVAVAYDLNFDITERDNYDGGLGFKMPFTSPAALDVSAASLLHLTRQGQRQFKTGDRWGKLILNRSCDARPPRNSNSVYPISGSIGIDRLVASFVDISDQGGAKDSFVETLTFTTQVGANATAGLKLNAVPHSFRVVSASASVEAGRIDVHKLVMSIVFPKKEEVEAITGVELSTGYLNAPFNRSPDWRARYNICVADARLREDLHKTLRLQAPEIYCIEYADKFAPSPARRVAASTSPGGSKAAAKDGGATKEILKSTLKPVSPRLYTNQGYGAVRPDTN